VSSQKINCMVSQCKHNEDGSYCELKTIKIADISQRAQTDHDTMCSNFEH